MIDRAISTPVVAVIASLVTVWMVAAAVAVGFPGLDTATNAQGVPRLIDFSIALAGVSTFWWLVRRSPVLASPMVLAAAMMLGIGVALVGVVPFAALGVVAGTASVVARTFAGAVSSPAARLVLGLGVVAGVVGWLLPLPIFSPTTAALALGSIALAGWKSVRDELRCWCREAGLDAKRDSAGASGWAWVLAVVVGSAPAWLPLRNPDDLSFRIGLGLELLEYGHARFDVGTQVWSLSPWNSEVLHALMTLLAGGEAAGPLSAFWVLVTAWLARGIAIQLGASPAAALWAGALYASLPITGFLAGGLQTEAMSAAVLAALVTVLLEHRDSAPRRALLAAALLAGVMLGTKVSNALLLLPIGVWLILRWRTHFPLGALPEACAAGFLAGGASYTYAWSLTGNPVLPVMNGIFLSPWFTPGNFVDATWQTGFSWTLPWAILVDTGKYFEGITGAAGLLPILVLGLLPVAAACPRVRVAALVGLAGFALVMSQVQYLRYAHPALVLIIPAFVAGLSEGVASRVMLSLAVVVQSALLPTGSWMFMHGILRERVVGGEHAVLVRYAPEKLLVADFKAMAAPSDRLLMTDPLRGFIALLPGRAVGANWHNPRIEALRVVDWNAPETWARIIRETGANYAIAPIDNSLPWLDKLLAENSSGPVAQRGVMQLVALQIDRKQPVLVEKPGDGGRTRVRADIPAAFSWAGTARIDVACDKPGEPVAVAWSATSNGHPVAQHWEWLYCPQGRRMTAARDIELPASAADRFEILIGKALEDSSMVVNVRSAAVELRRDLMAETDLADALLPDGCRGLGCAERGPRIIERPIHPGRDP